MTMRDLYNNLAEVIAITPQTIVNSGSPENLVSAGIDLQGFNAAKISVFMGDIDELGGSPVGSAKLEVILEHSDDDSTYTNVVLAEITDMPDEGADTFPIAFGDFRRAYLIVDRINLSILRDPFTQGTSGTIRFIARRRVGGQVVLAEAIRKLKCSV